jgi:hypothetical protein
MGTTDPLLLRIILSPSTPHEYYTLHHLPLSTAISTLTTSDLLHQIQVLDEYRRTCTNLYARVRCLLFLYAVHRFYLPLRRGTEAKCRNEKKEYIICPQGYAALLDRRFDEAIDHFLVYIRDDPDSIRDYDEGEGLLPKRIKLISDLTFDPTRRMATIRVVNGEIKREDSRYSSVDFLEEVQLQQPQKQPQSKLLLPSEVASSSLAATYRSLAFQTLADQVKSSVKNHPGNEWMFSVQGVKDQVLRFREELLSDESGMKMLLEKTPVRMDLSHSW